MIACTGEALSFSIAQGAQVPQVAQVAQVALVRLKASILPSQGDQVS